MTDLTDITRRMDSAIETLKKELTGLRTGRASVNLLDAVVVEAYGSRMPLSQVGTVNVPEPRMLTVQVWDTSMTQSVEKAIRESGLGLNPSSDGNLVRIPIPALNEERRKEMVKVAGKYGEAARIAIRNVRRDGMDLVKKDASLSEDQKKKSENDIQKLTDDHIKLVDTNTDAKEKEIMQV